MNEKEFTQNGITLVFYVKPGDNKFSFLVKDNPSLTEKILSNVSTKKVNEDNIHYCKKAIFELIENNKLNQKNEISQDYISLVKQKLDRSRSNEVEELPVEVNMSAGQVTFTVILDGITKIAKTASNKKIAKQLCYKEVLEKI